MAAIMYLFQCTKASCGYTAQFSVILARKCPHCGWQMVCKGPVKK